MWPFKQKEQDIQPLETNNQDIEDLATSEPDEWSTVRVEGSRIIFDDQPIGTAEPVNVSSSTEISERVKDDILAKYPLEKFHASVIRIAHFVSKVGKLKSLDLDKNDEDFFAACEVIHRRLANPALEPVLEFMSNDDIQDIFVLYYGFGPIVSDVYAEIKAKKATRKGRKVGPVQSVEVSIETEDAPIRPNPDENEQTEGGKYEQS